MNKFLIAGAAGTLAATASFAMAATLGGIETTDLGADASVVASCDTDGVEVDYATAFDPVAGLQEVTEVIVTGIDASCAGQTIDVGLTDADGTTSVDAVQQTLDGASAKLTITGGFPAESVDNVSIVISG